MTKHQIGTFLLGLLAAFVFDSNSGLVNASPPAKPQNASKRDDRLHKLFVEECVQITPGKEAFPAEFQMGGLNEGPLSLPPKEVKMTSPFRICKYEVTQELYESIMGSNPSRWKGKRNSVEMVSFADAERFCKLLTAELKSHNLIGKTEMVRLPTEAEWEYCCRAGTKTRYSFGDSATSAGDQEPKASVLNAYAWHTGNAAGNDPVVGALKPNPWGLYDMHGYLWEFVSGSATTEKPGDRILRGGSWREDHSQLTSGYRRSSPLDAATDAIGFRCVISEPPVSP